MKTEIMLKLKVFLTASWLAISIVVNNFNANAQVFTGFNAFKNIIEYEGQRYLMDEIYEISIKDYDKLIIDKTISEIDAEEGFMFVLVSYKFNDKTGVVITSFNSVSFDNLHYQFRNVHLTNEEFTNLYETFWTLAKNKIADDEHMLKTFNDRLILDVYYEAGFLKYALWVDNYSRHTFEAAKLDKVITRYRKFVEK
ncbi:MAG: hypothetical protein KA285_02565 [Bacteroidia bacterium]|nr:hypothetical protein [Bacteroidia bacterium]